MKVNSLPFNDTITLHMWIQCIKWSCFLGQLCGFAKAHLVYVHAAFRIFTWSKYAAFGVRLSSAV